VPLSAPDPAAEVEFPPERQRRARVTGLLSKCPSRAGELEHTALRVSTPNIQ